MSEPEDHSDDAALAGEYVLHLLGQEERTAFEARLAAEPALRDLVRRWQEDFATLAEDIAPVPPPPMVKDKLTAALFPDTARRKRPVWGWLAGGVLATAVAVGAVLLVPPLLEGPTFAPSLTASVAAQDGTLVIAASFIEETNVLEVVREAGAARPGRALELWLIADGADAPVSLGVLPETSEARIDLPPALAAQLVGGVLAISDEPPGGSPTGAPSGDVLAVGPVVSI